MMGMRCEYATLPAGELAGWAAERKAAGWQFVQMCAARTEDGIDLLYTLRRDDEVLTTTVAIGAEDHVPSVTGQWLAAFVFENEAHDLFGVHIDDIAIDFEGNFYRLAQEKPMMVLSPAQIAEREKAAKIKAAQEAKKAKAAKEAQDAGKAAEVATPAPEAPGVSASEAGGGEKTAAEVAPGAKEGGADHE